MSGLRAARIISNSWNTSRATGVPVEHFAKINPEAALKKYTRSEWQA
jgi:hypothetical protein